VTIPSGVIKSELEWAHIFDMRLEQVSNSDYFEDVTPEPIPVASKDDAYLAEVQRAENNGLHPNDATACASKDLDVPTGLENPVASGRKAKWGERYYNPETDIVYSLTGDNDGESRWRHQITKASQFSHIFNWHRREYLVQEMRRLEAEFVSE
jgi:hypothetical protein